MTLTRARLEVLAEVGDRLAIAEAMTVINPGSAVEDYAYWDTDEKAQAELKELLAMSRVDFDTAWIEGLTPKELSLFGPWRPTTREQIIALMKPEEAHRWASDLDHIEAEEQRQRQQQQQRDADESWGPSPLREHERLLERLAKQQQPKRNRLLNLATAAALGLTGVVVLHQFLPVILLLVVVFGVPLAFFAMFAGCWGAG